MAQQATIIRLSMNAVNPPDYAPVLINEPLDFEGALMLLDPSHAWNDTTIGTTLNNLLSSRAINTLSLDSSANVGGDGIALTTAGSSTLRYAERTGKDAIHLYYAASAGSISSNIMKYAFPAAILAHMQTSGHEFYVGLSQRITYNPTGLGTNATRNQWSGITYNDTGFLYSFDTQSDKPASGVTDNTFINRVGTASDAVLGLVHRSLGFNKTLATTNGANPMFGIGRNSNWTVGTQPPACAILYTLFICDLTVANKTAAKVDEIFQARQAALFAENGRYYNDTWTDPATK